LLISIFYYLLELLIWAWKISLTHPVAQSGCPGNDSLRYFIRCVFYDGVCFLRI
jgi:hypothetical protein